MSSPSYHGTITEINSFNDGVRPRRQERTGDDAIIETYLKHVNLDPHSERGDARRVGRYTSNSLIAD